MINLLSPKYKMEIRQEENRKLVLILSSLFLIFLIALFLILFSVKIYIQGQLESLKVLVKLEEKTLQIPETQELKGKISISNQNISKLNSFYKTRFCLIELFEKIYQTLPSGIYLTAFSWQKGTSQIGLSGFVPTRDILFEFKKNLEKQEEFGEINFPPQNWIEPTNINFIVTFQLKPLK